RLRCRDDGSASRRLEVIRLRVSELVHAVREVGPNGPTTARHVSDAAAPRECKAGAELEPARIRLRSQIRDEPKAARDLRNDVVPALRAGETQPETGSGRIERTAAGSEIPGGLRFRRVDQVPIGRNSRDLTSEMSGAT